MTVTYRDTKGAKISNAEQDSSLRSLNWRHGGTLASSASVSLTNEYNYFDISGSTNITTFSKASVEAGFLVRITFSSAGGSLVHNATSFILPGSANITWAAGDTAVFVNLNASGNWKCIDYSLFSLAPSSQVNATALTSNLIPATGNTYDLGSLGSEFRNLYIDGTGRIDQLTLLSGATVQEFSTDTTLSGSSNLSVPTEHAAKQYSDTVGAHAYGLINSAGTLISDYNIDTVVPNFTGKYTFTMANAASDALYTVVATAATATSAGPPAIVTSIATSSSAFVLYAWDVSGVLVNAAMHFAIFDNNQGI